MEQIEKTAPFTTPAPLPGWIVLARVPGENSLQGYIENSWSMGWHKDRVRFWWTGEGTDNVIGMKWQVDGKADAERHAETCRQNHPDWEVFAYDIADPACPVELEFAGRAKADKYESRNPRFRYKGDG